MDGAPWGRSPGTGTVTRRQQQHASAWAGSTTAGHVVTTRAPAPQPDSPGVYIQNHQAWSTSGLDCLDVMRGKAPLAPGERRGCGWDGLIRVGGPPGALTSSGNRHSVLTDNPCSKLLHNTSSHRPTQVGQRQVKLTMMGSVYEILEEVKM